MLKIKIELTSKVSRGYGRISWMRKRMVSHSGYLLRNDDTQVLKFRRVERKYIGGPPGYV